MTMRQVFDTTIALIAVGLGTRASAACNPPKFAASYNPAIGRYIYWTTSINPISAGLLGRIWSNGVDYTGTCNDGAQSFPADWGVWPGQFGISFSLGNACVPPGRCPSGNLNLRVWVQAFYGVNAQETFARQVPETPTGGVNFDFSDLAVTLAPSPRPRVQSSSRVGSMVNVSTLPEPIPGDAASLATVMGCNILVASATTWPGFFPAAYPKLLSTVPKAGEACAATTVAVDCSTTTDKWLVYQIVTDAGPDPYVGPATRVFCDQALADPTKKFAPKKSAIEVRD